MTPRYCGGPHGAPEWAVGMRKLGAGIYIDEKSNSIHFSDREICEALGVEATEENLVNARQGAAAAVAGMYPGVPIVETDDRE